MNYACMIDKHLAFYEKLEADLRHSYEILTQSFEPSVSLLKRIFGKPRTTTRSARSGHGGSHRVNGSSSGGNSSGDPDPEPARPRLIPRLLATRLDAFKEVLA